MPEYPRIGVALITKNREKQLQRLLPQLARFDQVVVQDTGSSDGSQGYVKSLEGPFKWHECEWRAHWLNANRDDYGMDNWGFSYARNQSFSHLNTEYALWIDTDDLLADKEGKFLEPEVAYSVFQNLIRQAPDRDLWFMKYVYGRDEQGNVIATQHRERFMRMDADWLWKYPIHEILSSGREAKVGLVDDLEIHHYKSEENDDSSERNRIYTELWWEEMEHRGIEDHHMGRASIIYAQSLWNQSKWKEAAHWLLNNYIKRFQRVLKDVEIWQAWSWICQCQLALENLDAAEYAALECIRIRPSLAFGYIKLAEVKMRKGAHPKDAIMLLKQCSFCDDPPPEVIWNPMDYTFQPYCIMSDAHFQLGNYRDALGWGEKALKLDQSSDHARYLWAQAQKEVAREDARNAALALYDHLHDFEENEKANGLYHNLPYIIQKDPEIQAQALRFQRYTQHLRDDEAYEKFYAESPRTVPMPEEMFLEDIPIATRTLWFYARVQQAEHILDVGCADGFMTLWLAKQGKRVVGLDLDKKAIALGTERAEKYELSAKFIQGFFEKMDPRRIECPFCPGQSMYQHYDAVISGEVLEHVQNDSLFIGALTDCAKDNAPVLISTPNGCYDGFLLKHPEHEHMQHVRAYTLETFERLLKTDPDHHVMDAHVALHPEPVHEEQGWLMGHVQRRARPNGPVIRIMCGGNDFSPFSLGEGIGGSETAVIELARGFAKRDCQVVVYTGGPSGIWDGVFYRNSKDFNPEHRSDVFIAWRMPQAFANLRPNANTTVLWNHDTDYPQLPIGIPDDWAERIDLVACLSPWHQDHFGYTYPNLKEKIWVTRNGLDPVRYQNKEIEQVKDRFFYSSSWDRGLFELLQIWPKIKQVRPRAELYIAYGYELLMEMAKTYRTGAEILVKEALQKIKEDPSLHYKGKMNQEDLADLQLSCEYWIYPPHGFNETYCITAREAMAAGCKIISRKNGALPYTIKHAIWWTDLRDIKRILKSEVWTPQWTEENKKLAFRDTWDTLADEWLVKLHEVSAVAA